MKLSQALPATMSVLPIKMLHVVIKNKSNRNVRFSGVEVEGGRSTHTMSVNSNNSTQSFSVAWLVCLAAREPAEASTNCVE